MARRLAGGLFILLAVPADAGVTGFGPIEVSPRPIREFLTGRPETRFGALEFRGGLELTSPAHEFGGLSGLDFSLDGTTLYAVSDAGLWFSARLVEESGWLAGLKDTRLGPILDKSGNPLRGKRQGDAEALRIVERDGKETALVTFEQTNEVRAFVASPEFADARPRSVSLPKTIRGLPRDTGLEALAVAPVDGPLQGAIVLVAEDSRDQAGNDRAWIVGGPRAGSFAIKRTDGFSVTDAAFLGDGDLLILERKLSLKEGLVIRLRRLAAEGIRPKATADGAILLEADMRHQIDNMEGMAVRLGDGGETLITLISDNNRSLFQRTLLLQFALVPAPATASDVGLRSRS